MPFTQLIAPLLQGIFNINNQLSMIQIFFRYSIAVDQGIVRVVHGMRHAVWTTVELDIKINQQMVIRRREALYIGLTSNYHWIFTYFTNIKISQ